MFHHVPFLLGFAFMCIVSTWASAKLEKTEKRLDRYNYAIEVNPVDRCPMNELDWKAAANRTGCNDTRGYHCVPDKFHESLIEFCYIKPRILVANGNCLELADNGILNHVKCENFTGGCPDSHYLSDEIYRYPVCLSLAFGCFTSDRICLYGQCHSKSDSREEECAQDLNKFYVFLSLFIFVVIVLTIIGVIICRRKKRMNELKSSVDTEDESHKSLIDKQSMSTIKETETENTQEIGKLAEDKSEFGFTFLCMILKELECEHTFEDNSLLQLLREHCLLGAFENFDYLLKARIMDKNDQSLLKILEARDKDGRTLLHHAAEGGSKDIFKSLRKVCPQLSVADTAAYGYTLLHLACKKGKYDMCAFLLSDNNYKDLLGKESSQGWNAAHFAAVGGSVKILNLLNDKKLNITSNTKNGLNILDFACIYNHAEMCNNLIKRSKQNKLNLPLDKHDARGWTISHFVAMVGNKDIFDRLTDSRGIKRKTYSKKTVLHICCEYGHSELCKEIIMKHANMLHDEDENGWNALHYAAKGGNLDVLKEIDKAMDNDISLDNLCKETDDGKTALHICCIYKHVKLCEYICKKLKSDRNLINKKTKKLWTAAHYVAVEMESEDGSEEKLICILVESGMDITSVTIDNYTVLTVACEHRNYRLIDFLIKNYPSLLDIKTWKLEKVAEETKDKDIESKIRDSILKRKRY